MTDDLEESVKRVAQLLERIEEMLKEENERRRRENRRELSLGASHNAIRRGFEGTGR